LFSVFFVAEERPALSRAGRATDAAIAAAGAIAAVITTIVQYRDSGPGAINARPGYVIIQPGPPAAWPSAWLLLGVALTVAPLAFRRVYPITAFWMVLLAVIATSGHTTGIQFAAIIFAAYCAAVYSPFRWLALLSVLVAGLIVTAAYPDTTPPIPQRLGALLVLLPTLAVGIAIRVWRRRAGESAERLRRAQAGHEAETRRAVALERARIASEMHDVVTHNVSVMVVQAGAARRVLDSSPDEAREALLAVEASGRTAMAELRHLLGLLTSSEEPGPGAAALTAGPAPAAGGDAALTPQPGVARIPALLARVCAAGMPVELSVLDPGGAERTLSPGVDLAAFRIVQEGLTNVMKHAGQARSTVRLEYRPRDLLITVSDDGPPPGSGPPAAAAGPGTGPGAGPGRGLIGLRERIAVYGGELDAGPRPGGGWRLTARIPLEPAAAEMPVQAEFQAAW
jgi:signal transduction histidine kinase